MAMRFGHYAARSMARPLAVGAVVVLTVVNYRGVQKTVLLTRIIVWAVLLVLAVVAFAVWFGGAADVGRLWPLAGTGVYGILQSAGFLFFALAGDGRLAPLGGEEGDPRPRNPRGIPIAPP